MIEIKLHISPDEYRSIAELADSQSQTMKDYIKDCVFGAKHKHHPYGRCNLCGEFGNLKPLGAAIVCVRCLNDKLRAHEDECAQHDWAMDHGGDE